MGKIRVKTFEESPEEEAKLKAKKEAKKVEKMALKNAAKKGETTPVTEVIKTVVTPKEIIETQNETETEPVSTETSETDTPPVSESVIPAEAGIQDSQIKSSETETKPAKKAKKEKFIKVKEIGKRHKENLSFISKNQTYTIEQALESLKKFKKSKFDETVELHINTKEKGVSGQVTLPHGTGKTLVIKIADEAILAEIAKGKINFDILVATPSMMPQLARVAKILGPRGLMPNPKNGTIADKPEEAVKKLSAGQITYKTEAISPIIHVSVGKISFEDKKLKENIATLLSSVGASNISNVTLKSTMSPGIKLDYLAK